MTTRIVLADQSGARLYDLNGADGPWHLVGELTNPAAHQHNRDLKSDRPGRVFDHAAGDVGRRGAVAHHATGGEETPKRHEAEVLASHLAQELESARVAHRFDRLVVLASPRFLGELRSAMSKPLRRLVVLEVAKDLMHASEDELRTYLPKAVLEPVRPAS